MKKHISGATLCAVYLVVSSLVTYFLALHRELVNNFVFYILLGLDIASCIMFITLARRTLFNYLSETVRNRFEIFTEDGTILVADSIELIGDHTFSLKDGEFMIHYVRKNKVIRVDSITGTGGRQKMTLKEFLDTYQIRR